ncbi:hypothetical protein BHAOGJBA_3305 [Methylobacterium hispanicum]|jgi:hypothetical protein|uniref:Phage holin family protein n=1 Tax=Methylobacterium hispanicum TaxID=270350 RepID=A0AAV4ZQC6_9HYPH|nr:MULTISPECIES: hypothetical protein [Methylobacterium]GJD89775.1 hypothetical protein BHAOGJBA_3305 [Methylobacterium hispanicum]
MDGLTDPDPEVRRVARALHRLEALAARRRLRVRVMRGLRGILGGGATLGLLIKAKVAGSLGLKVALAALVGLGLAWPALVLLVLGLVGVLLAILSLFDGGGSTPLDCDCPCDCKRKEERALRLKRMIARRRDWLQARLGPAPGREAPARYAPRV